MYPTWDRIVPNHITNYWLVIYLNPSGKFVSGWRMLLLPMILDSRVMILLNHLDIGNELWLAIVATGGGGLEWLIFVSFLSILVYVVYVVFVALFFCVNVLY